MHNRTQYTTLCLTLWLKPKNNCNHEIRIALPHRNQHCGLCGLCHRQEIGQNSPPSYSRGYAYWACCYWRFGWSLFGHANMQAQDQASEVYHWGANHSNTSYCAGFVAANTIIFCYAVTNSLLNRHTVRKKHLNTKKTNNHAYNTCYFSTWTTFCI